MTGALLAAPTSRVLAALERVRDPELDEPVTSLGFVASCTVDSDGAVEVHLRLPTYFCAPNFAFLMVADAYDAVRAVEGVSGAVVVLDDHFASDAINAGVAARAGFVGTFGSEAVDELDALRRNFVARAVLAGTDQVCRPLFAAGHTQDDVALMTLGDVPPSPQLEALCTRRAEIGLPVGPGAPLLIDPDMGTSVPPAQRRTLLARARLSQVNIEANGSICRGMLAARYPDSGRAVQDEGVAS